MPITKPLARMPNIDKVQNNAPPAPRVLRTQHSADQIGIYRAFCSSRGGYYAHVMIHRNGKIFQRDFFEKRCGGEKEARKLAQAWRDTIIAKHPPTAT